MKNLVMGAVKSYGAYDLEPFILSLKKFSLDADLVFFVDDVSDFTANYIKNIYGGGKVNKYS